MGIASIEVRHTLSTETVQAHRLALLSPVVETAKVRGDKNTV